MINRHLVKINASQADVFPEIVSWGESSWWPADSQMRYTRLTDTGGGDVGVGTRYNQKVLVPFGPAWDVEVESVTPDASISRRFLNGMFRGVERVEITPADGVCEVRFQMDYEVVGWYNRLLWPLVFVRMHDINIEKILGAMKAYVEGRRVT